MACGVDARPDAVAARASVALVAQLMTAVAQDDEVDG